MEHLECPAYEVWNERRQWFEEMMEQTAGVGSYLVGEQASALSADVQCTFCAGAWAAVIILAMAVVESQLREAEVLNGIGTSKWLIDQAQMPELHSLRIRRNALVHANPDSPALTVEKQWLDRGLLEGEAKIAVRLMFKALFLSPGT